VVRWTFTGSVDELSVYNQALSASDILAIYNLGSRGKSVGSPSSTAERVSTLRSGPLAAGRVKSNKQHNVLLGGSGPNLFLTSGIIDATNQSASDASFTL